MADVLRALARRRVTLGFVTGAVALVFASPTWRTWWTGLVVAMAGEALRVWASGHLEKGREVTSSGPYRWMRHPLYAGSSVMALGAVVAANSAVVAVVVAIYIVVTIGAAVRTEEASLRAAFGEQYDRYRRSERATSTRPFSLARARRNREHRSAMGLATGFALLAAKVALPI